VVAAVKSGPADRWLLAHPVALAVHNVVVVVLFPICLVWITFDVLIASPGWPLVLAVLIAVYAWWVAIHSYGPGLVRLARSWRRPTG
jgi:hypothetical protein